MKMKKVVWTVCIVVASVCVVCLLFRAVVFNLFSYTNTWIWSAEYEEYASEFNVVKDYVAEQYASEDERRLSVASTLNGHGRTLYDPNTKEYAQLPENVQTALDTIAENGFPYKDSNLDDIRIYGDRVDFCISYGTYHLVYSPDEKPTWLHDPDEETEIKVKRIKDGWYHVVRD